MDRYVVALRLSSERTRVLMRRGPDEVLRAVLPPLVPPVRYPRTVTTFLEGLAMWTDQRLRVVLPAGESDASFFLDLTDERGVGASRLFYEVESVEPRVRRPARLGGVGDFRDMRQLLLPEVSR
jgi:hypothetical protein